MSAWSSGYNVEQGYTFKYYKELSPQWLDFVAVLNGVRPPSACTDTAALRYLELGCGQGLGLVMLAALHPEREFLGIDFNPEHIAHARGLAHAAGLKNVRFEEADFVALGENWPATWGAFDYIAAHGIYSWLSPFVREQLVKTIDRASAPGALVYLSYNVLPGWLTGVPVQHLLRLWQRTEALDSSKAIASGIDRLKKLEQTNVMMAQALPQLKEHLAEMGAKEYAYLIQEYLHNNWHPRWFDEIADELASAKLRYVGSASANLLLPLAGWPDTWQAQLAAIGNRVVREVTSDVMANRSFRRDLFSRGAPPAWPGATSQRLHDTRFVLNAALSGKAVEVPALLSESKGNPELFTPLYEQLLAGPKSIAAMQASHPLPGLSLRSVVEALTQMLAARQISLFVPLEQAHPALALNRALCSAVLLGAPYRNLISTKFGNVQRVAEADMMLAAIYEENRNQTAAEMGMALARRFVMLGRKINLKSGESLATPEAMHPVTTEMAGIFIAEAVPRWRNQGIIG